MEKDIKETAKNIPKGFTVADSEALRVNILNVLVTRLFSGTLKRGEEVAKMSNIIGFQEDRPKQLVQLIKGGGGTQTQLEELWNLLKDK